MCERFKFTVYRSGRKVEIIDKKDDEIKSASRMLENEPTKSFPALYRKCITQHERNDLVKRIVERGLQLRHNNNKVLFTSFWYFISE